jgi:hypothetical protein
MEFKFEPLLAQYPEIGVEAFGWDASNLLSDSHEKIAWECKNNHIWVEKIINRTHFDVVCPKCSTVTEI